MQLKNKIYKEMDMEEIKNNKKSKILIIIGIAALLTAVIELSYAYFLVNVTNIIGSSINIDFVKLGTVTYESGNEINLNEMYPGDVVTKNFTIARSGADEDTKADYTINLIVYSNTLTGVAQGEFIYELRGINSGLGTPINVEESIVPTSTRQIGESGFLIGNEIHSYSFTLTLNETGSNQNSTRGMGFAGKIEVVSAAHYDHDYNNPIVDLSDYSSQIYPISFNYDLKGGTTNQNLLNTYDYGSEITLENPTKENFIFTGWTVIGGSLNNGVLALTSPIVEITANWISP